MEYTVEQKLSGLDLHGLPCRIPDPVGKQKECSHTEFKWTESNTDGYFDHNEEWVPYRSRVEVTTMHDIQGTNNMKCCLCGYQRRY
jgi:hypothetical protein